MLLTLAPGTGRERIVISRFARSQWHFRKSKSNARKQIAHCMLLAPHRSIARGKFHAKRQLGEMSMQGKLVPRGTAGKMRASCTLAVHDSRKVARYIAENGAAR